MAYGEEFKYFFYWDHDSGNNYYKVSILKLDYVSTVTELTPGPNPWAEVVQGQLDTSENPILGGQVNFQIIEKDESLDDALLGSDYKDYIVKLIQDPDGTPIVKWVGFMLPQNASRNYLGKDRIYTCAAADGLSDLKNKYYSSDGTQSGSPLTGFENMLVIIKTALSYVADITELQLDFKIHLSTHSDQMTSTENAFAENEVVQELFFEVKDGETVFNTCYEVIQKILQPFYCQMAQSDGNYRIWNIGEITIGNLFEYDWATLTQQSRTVPGRLVDIENYKFTQRGTLYKTSPFATFFLRLFNKDFDPELIVNGGFDTTIAGWTNGDADNDSNQWDAIDWFNFVTIGGTLSAQWAGVASAGKFNYHTTASINLEFGSGKQNVTVFVRVEHNSSTPGGLSSPKIKMRLWNATDGYISGAVGAQELGTIGGFVTIRETFVMTSGVTVANNFLDIEIEATDVSTTSLQFYFDSVTMSQPAENDPTDWIYRSGRTGGSQTINKEEIVYLSERQESDNDICAIKDDGGTYVTSWNRFGHFNDIPLLQTLQQLKINDNNEYMEHVRATVYDPNETIFIHDDVLHRLKTFRILGITKNYRTAQIELDMIQSFQVFDISAAFGKQKLTSKYGQSQD